MRFPISRLLIVFGATIVVGLSASIGVQTYTLQRLKVNGPVYKGIIEGKDLVADILPPPLYLVETYMLANEAAVHPDMLAANTAKILKLKADYADRGHYWRDSGLPDKIKAKLENDVQTKADTFWSDLDDKLVVLKLGDAEKSAAAMESLKTTFHAHEAAVLELVAMTGGFLKQQEMDTGSESDRLQRLALSGSALSIVLFLGGVLVIRRRAISPLGRMTRFMSEMADGKLEETVPFTGRRDEIGDMASAVEVFRLAGLENLRLAEEAGMTRSVSEAERLEREEARREEARQLQLVVDTLGAGLGRLSECNIRMTIDEPFQQNFEALRHDFNNSLAIFQSTLEQVLAKTRDIHASGEEMREASDNLSKRTEQQAAALEQTSAALNQVTATVRSSAERTNETRALVAEAKRSTVASTLVVGEAISAMGRIETASSEIAQILGTIEEIAFQTNLLALNAGVEAARAGDTGKGFAVVAQEVRELAQRSARAAKEIKTLIVNSSVEVQTGVRLVGKTGVVLGEIESHVSSIDVKIDAIATAAREQAIGLEEISSAVNNIDQMTQQNAAMVEETTAISHALSQGTTILGELVSRFRLNRRSTVRDAGHTALKPPIQKSNQRRVA